MSTSPSLSLALIVKNEEKNLTRLLSSVEGCFNEIVLVDTGSTDKTKEIAESFGCKIFDFEWVNSFSKARNFAFSKTSGDYVMWMDGDDVLGSRENFLAWKETSMGLSDAWFATYNYAFHEGKPVVSFIRERVFKKSLQPVWQYDLHEGIILKPEWAKDLVQSWTVDHMRDAEDMQADKSRNIKILEELKASKGLDARLQFYYGKELFEVGKLTEAIQAFDHALAQPHLEPHDRLLSYQYASYSAQAQGDLIKDESREEKNNWYAKAIDYAITGLKYDSNRAEFYVSAADCYLKKGEVHKSVPMYGAAKTCFLPEEMVGNAQAIFSFKNCYGELPALQLAKIYFNLGRPDDAKREAEFCFEKYKNEEAKKLIKTLEDIKPLITLENNQTEVEDVVFTCPPQAAYPFDEKLYEEKGMGGSETALIEMAREIKKKTGRPVKVFNVRDENFVSDSGVEYLSNKELNLYFSKNKPKAHIAWRHNIRVTKAPTYLWCHDLVTPTVERVQNFDHLLCLSPFHKNYVQGKQGVSREKIVITRNGITPSKFDFERKEKNPNKLVWLSSPDRGLDRAMLVCDEVRQVFPDIELHVYYGLDNLYKYGMHELAQKLQGMMDERAYVKYHGFTEQKKMAKEISDAVVWIHPCNFIETFCITALEALALGIFPVTRKLGALANTLQEAEKKGQALLLDHDCITKPQILQYANAVCAVLSNQSWKNVNLDIENHSWRKVSEEWIQMMDL